MAAVDCDGGAEVTDDERDAEIEMLRAQVAALTAKKQRSKRVKPEAVPYETLLQQLPLDAHAAWQGWIAMVAAKNKCGTIAESRRDSLLQDLLRRCAGLSADAIAYGLCEATKGGKDSVGYAAVAAQNYAPRDRSGYTPQTYTPPAKPPSAPRVIPQWVQNLPDGAIPLEDSDCVILGGMEIPLASAMKWWADGPRDDLPPDATSCASAVNDYKALVAQHGVVGALGQTLRGRTIAAIGNIPEDKDAEKL
jgi:hypothetical protein